MYIPPQAHRYELADCGSPNCRAVHVILFDKDDICIAQMTLLREQIERILTGFFAIPRDKRPKLNAHL